MENQLQRGAAKVAPPAASKVEEMKPPATGMTLQVRAFRFTGNHKLTDQALSEALQSLVGQNLGFEDLKAAAAQVAKTYADKGWVVRAFLPEQDVTAGTVTIAVVEARFGQVILEGEEPVRITHQRLQKMATRALPSGEPLSAPALERLLLTYQDLPGVEVSGSLIAGAEDGETSLRLRAKDRASVNGSVMLDNSGSRAYGMSRTLASLNWNSPSRQGDQLNAIGAITEGSEYGRLAYSWPSDLIGSRLSVVVSNMHYKLTAPEFSALQAKGNASTMGLEYSSPLVRSQQRNLSWNVGLEHKTFRNWSAQTLTSDYRTQVLTAGLSGNALDSLNGQTGFETTVVMGQVNLDGSPNQTADAAADQTAGQFRKLKFGIQRTQALSTSSYVLMSLGGQFANKNLDSSEKFYLGGPAGVRGFPAAEGGGNDGLLVNLEWHQRWWPQTDTGLFVTTGTVRPSRSISGETTLPKSYSLSAAGIVVQWEGPGSSTLKGTWSRRLRANPNANAAGKDQDGSYVRDRLWLQASWTF